MSVPPGGILTLSDDNNEDNGEEESGLLSCTFYARFVPESMARESKYLTVEVQDGNENQSPQVGLMSSASDKSNKPQAWRDEDDDAIGNS